MENSELEKLGVWLKGLKEHSEVFISEFSVLGIVQNGKLEVGKTRSLVKRLERALRGFYLRVFRFGYSAKWKTRS